MASKIQRLVSQAKATFTKMGVEPVFSDEMKKLKEVINTLTSEDFNLSPRVAHKQWDYHPYVVDSPSSCIEIYQCPEFSVGIFLIKPHKHMPFHDHPGMYGVMKVLFSSMTVTSYSKVKGQEMPTQGVPVRCRFLSRVNVDSNSEPCVLYPEQGNIHQIQAGEEAVAFIDILAPPYNPKEGRDCNYYEKMGTKEDEKDTISLMPGPNPSWFSCVPLSYDGPRPS